MKQLYITLLLIGFVSLSYSQPTSDEVYYYQGTSMIEDVLFQVQGASTCTDVSFDIGNRARVVFKQVLGVDKYLVELKGNLANKSASINDNYALINRLYCIDKDFFDNNFRETPQPKTRKDYGVLVVPFKVRFDPVQITAGGELGGYYGWYMGKHSTTVAVFHAGLTFISLNDLNSETPETKLGFTGGIGLINKVSKNFQMGLVTGIDLFEGVEDWTYGYKPWLSLQIGFTFTK